LTVGTLALEIELKSSISLLFQNVALSQ